MFLSHSWVCEHGSLAVSQGCFHPLGQSRVSATLLLRSSEMSQVGGHAAGRWRQSVCPPSIKGVMQLTRHDITPTEARRVWLGIVLLSGRFGPRGPCRLSRALPHAGGDAGWNYTAWISGNMTRFAVMWSRVAAVADTEESLGFFCLCGDNPQLLDKDPTSCTQSDPAAVCPDK